MLYTRRKTAYSGESSKVKTNIGCRMKRGLLVNVPLGVFNGVGLVAKRARPQLPIKFPIGFKRPLTSPGDTLTHLDKG